METVSTLSIRGKAPRASLPMELKWIVLRRRLEMVTLGKTMAPKGKKLDHQNVWQGFLQPCLKTNQPTGPYNSSVGIRNTKAFWALVVSLHPLSNKAWSEKGIYFLSCLDCPSFFVFFLHPGFHANRKTWWLQNSQHLLISVAKEKLVPSSMQRRGEMTTQDLQV